MANKAYRRILSFILCAITVMSFATVSYAATGEIKLSSSAITLVKGKTKKLTVRYRSSNAVVTGTVKWSSSNKSVASVSTSGKVTAKKVGTATITAKYGKRTVSCKVTVKKAVPLKSISLSKKSMTLTVGNSKKLTVSFNPSNTTASKTVSWVSSNKSVASVNSSGKITAKKAGTAVITAKCGKVSASCKVTVKKVSPYLDVTDAYTFTNNFRTQKSVWQWNSDNKTKTVFNTTSANTLSRLQRSASLEETAKIRAKEISESFSHIRPNGSICFTAYPFEYFCVGENIAYGATTCEYAIEMWKEENYSYSGQGHRRNMLDSSFSSIGIACYKDNGAYYWVMCLGG